jgi:glycosyltransferase involved in cell wall biosynthesis
VRLTVLALHPPGRVPGQRFRFEQWLRLLPAGSIDAEVLPLFSSWAHVGLYRSGQTPRKALEASFALARRVVQIVKARRSDVVLLYREAFPLGPPLLERLLKDEVPVVLDFDDAIYLGQTSSANARLRFLKRSDTVSERVAAATVVTVGNEELAAYSRDHNNWVEVVPTTIDIEEYVPARHRSARSPLRLGWSGSATTVAHLQTIDRALARVLDEYPVELTVVGDATYTLQRPNVHARSWCLGRELDDLRSFDIGIMPLPDDQWSRGKCGLKALQYMALEIPTIVSPVGVNAEIISDGSNGLFARTEEEWITALGQLIEDGQLRRALGSAGRATVVERFSGQAWAPRFFEILRDAAGTTL